ncbi:TPA: hypothetical protein SD616_001595 [Aeromonas hydrophila]|nr:hypothetical protein [Aeromonas hydrophila]
MIVNYLFLKNKNGMYYYSEDYILESKIDKVKRINSDLSCASIIDKFKYIIMLYYHALFYNAYIYTPTIHPLPFLSKQLVICHDSYPFKGFKGRIKRFLLKLSLYTSNCSVGFINHSDSKKFVDSLGVSGARTVFLPNLIKCKELIEVPRRSKNKDVLHVALVGTDSDKKRYEVLFNALLSKHSAQVSKLNFYLYGGESNYCKRILGKYSDSIKITWVNPGVIGLDDFISEMDVLVSVAKNEGFGRPIAFALQRGLLTLLIDDPVFKEFFSGSAHFFESESQLINSIQSIFEKHVPEVFPPEHLANVINTAQERFISLCK